MKTQTHHSLFQRQNRVENTNSHVPIAKRLVTDLHSALTNHDRLVALYHIKQSFSGIYGDPSIVGLYLLEERLLAALVLHLHAVVQRANSNTEISQILQLMDAALRLCPQHLQEQISLDLNTTYHDFASSELLPPSRISELPHLLSMLSILHTCSATASGSQQILKSRVTLMRMISILQNDGKISDECLLEALNVLKNICYFGDNHRLYLASLHGFLSSLSSLACRTVSESIMERLSAIFRNLAVAPECRNILTQSAGALRSLLRMGTCSNHVVVKNSLKALICLAMDTESCITVLYHGDGALISVIKGLVRLNQSHAQIRKRAIRLLRMLSKQKTFQFLAYDNDLVNLLSSVVKDDQCNEIRQEAIEAFSQCFSVVRSSAPNYNIVLDKMVEWAGLRSVSPEMFVHSIKEQASFFENGHVIAQRTRIIDIISQIAANIDSSPTARDDACHALWLLAKEKENRENLMASKCILSSLIVNAANFHDGLEETDDPASPSCRERAVQTIVYLAQSHTNRRAMVSYDKLLHVLIQFAATTHDILTKDQVKEVILWLVQEA